LPFGNLSERGEVGDAEFGHPRSAVLIPWHLILQFETGDGKLASSEQGDAGCGLFGIALHLLGVKLVADGHWSVPPGAPEGCSVLPLGLEAGEGPLRGITLVKEFRNVEIFPIWVRSGVRGNCRG